MVPGTVHGLSEVDIEYGTQYTRTEEALVVDLSPEPQWGERDGSPTGDGENSKMYRRIGCSSGFPERIICSFPYVSKK